MSETVSQALRKKAQQAVKELFIRFEQGDLTTLEEEPACVFSQEELLSMPSIQLALFCSHHCECINWPHHPFSSITPETPIDYCLFGMYVRKCEGGDRRRWSSRTIELVEEHPHLIIWVIPETFKAIIDNQRHSTSDTLDVDFNDLGLLECLEILPEVKHTQSLPKLMHQITRMQYELGDEVF